MSSRASLLYYAPVAAFLLAALAACDRDPARPTEALTLSACPTGPLDVNNPVTLAFSVPVFPQSVNAATVVVSDAATGLPIPGSLAMVPGDGARYRFIQSSPFRFSQRVRIRVQNVLSANTLSQISVTLCEVVTAAPPITQVFWRRIPNAGSAQLVGAALPSPDVALAMSLFGTIYRREAQGTFSVRYKDPYSDAGFDVAFATPTVGFAVQNYLRRNSVLLLQTTNGGATFDSVATISTGLSNARAFFRQVGSSIFGVIGGGLPTTASFYKYVQGVSPLTAQSFGGTGPVADLDFAPADTQRGAAVTGGSRIAGVDVRGKLYTTTDGGSSWSEVAGTTASNSVVRYFGVAKRANGDIFATGGNGFVSRISIPAGGGAPVITTVVPAPLVSPDTANALAFIYTDIQFAPDNDQVGWLVGAIQTGVDQTGAPRYQGLIFETRNGGTTWVRQGVKDAGNYGADFPRLNRLSVYSSTKVLIVGDGGTVLLYEPGT